MVRPGKTTTFPSLPENTENAVCGIRHFSTQASSAWGHPASLNEHRPQHERKVLSVHGLMVSSQDGPTAWTDIHVTQGGVPAVESSLVTRPLEYLGTEMTGQSKTLISTPCLVAFRSQSGVVTSCC